MIRSTVNKSLRRFRTALPVVRRRRPPGTSPAVLSVDPEALPPRITAIAYGPEEVVEKQLNSIDDIKAMRGRWPVLWINVDGLGDADLLTAMGEEFGLHRLAIEDVVNVHQRAKVEPYDDHIFMVVRMVRPDDGRGTEQVSLFIGKDYVLTFQERRGDSFDQVRARIQKARGSLRNAGPDYLAHGLIDALIDAYFPVLEKCADRLEHIEQDILYGGQKPNTTAIHAIKRELLVMLHAIRPHREAVNSLIREEGDLIRPDTRVYLRDCYDHVIQLLDIAETYRELASGLLEIYLSLLSNKMNEVMKVLTMFAAIFIPLSFIAGLYGMNFQSDSDWSMPELRWEYGYPAVLIVMASVALGLLYLFRRWGWIGSQWPEPGTDRKENGDGP